MGRQQGWDRHSQRGDQGGLISLPSGCRCREWQVHHSCWGLRPRVLSSEPFYRTGWRWPRCDGGIHQMLPGVLVAQRSYQKHAEEPVLRRVTLHAHMDACTHHSECRTCSGCLILQSQNHLQPAKHQAGFCAHTPLSLFSALDFSTHLVSSIIYPTSRL